MAEATDALLARVAALEAELAAAKRLAADAVDRQTATSEILRVIGVSPTDVQPVFDAIARSCVRLCHGVFSGVFRFDGDLIHLEAQHNFSADALQRYQRIFPLPPGPENIITRTILEQRVVHVPDIDADASLPLSQSLSRTVGFRSAVSVPMLRDGRPIGAVGVARAEPGAFSEQQIALLQTFAAQAVIAIENVRLFTELQEKNQTITEALEQQTATGEILSVISSSPTDEKPVFDAIARSSVRLCEATFSVVAVLDVDELLHLVASEHVGPEGRRSLAAAYPMRPDRGQLAGRAILDRAVVHVADVTVDPEYVGAALGNRATLSVPMLRNGKPIGTITIGRFEPVPFTDQQIDLLKTFADQAVIAIENVRLFTELQEKNRAVSAALEQQTATSEILRVISSSPTDVQPVFDAIVRSAQALTAAATSAVFIVTGDRIDVAAAVAGADGVSPQDIAAWRAQYPRVPTPDTVMGQAIRERQAVHVENLETDPRYPTAPGRLLGVRTILGVPMLRDGHAIGAIAVWRQEVKAFSDKHIALLQTFADQAVIAIENVRLFTELQEKNRALTEAHGQVTEALERQTATSEILRTIAHAQTDLQPVFDTIVQSAARLCHAANAAVFLSDGRMLYEPANFGSSPEARAAARARYPRPLGRETTPGVAVLTRSVVHVPDTEDISVIEHLRQSGRLLGFRSVVTVPMLRESEAVGALLVARREPGPFSDAEVAVLKTFADQAVIAVENVRLFKELEARTTALTRSVEQLTALGEVSRALSSTLDLETVLTTIVARASQLAGTNACTVYEYDDATGEFHWRASANPDEEVEAVARRTTIPRGVGAQGRMALSREPVQIPDIAVESAYHGPLRDVLLRTGTRAILAVPLLRDDQLVGSLTVNRKTPGEFTPEVVDLLKTFATQSALAIQNARLFREIEDKSRQLEAASQHKSEFLANMSHELRTPLNGIIGFSEVLLERMFGDINDKQDEYLKDILESGRHLLSLINDILDLSKIEAGRMELELSDFDLPAAIDDAMLLMRERAGRRGIALGRDVDDGVGDIRADQRKVKQVLLNLLSNAVKFTLEGGRISVGASLEDGAVVISVTDTGIGIAPEDHEAVFEEFRQVGKADKKAEGTGLGLALCRKFVELHGGRMWVTSEVGQGSTFFFAIPVGGPAAQRR